MDEVLVYIESDWSYDWGINAEGYLAGEWEETQLPMDVLLDLVESDWLLGVMCATGEAVGGQLEEARADLQLGREV